MKKKIGYSFLVLIVLILLSGCKKQYNVTFQLTEEESKIVTVSKQGTVEKMIPERKGYDFIKWLYQDVEFDFNTKIDRDIVLNALWAPRDIKVTYLVENKVYITEKTKAGGVLYKKPKPEIADKIFLNWVTKDGDIWNFNTKVYEDFSLYANFINDSEYIIDITINYNTTGLGTEIPSTNVKRLDNMPTLPVVTRKGYNFKGWYYKEEQVSTGQVIKFIEKEITLYAKWEETPESKKYTLSFDTGEPNTISSMDIYYNQLISLPVITSDQGTFLGWIYRGKVYKNAIIIAKPENVTLVAKWERPTKNLVINGENVKYRNSSKDVTIPVAYSAKEEEFRGAWISSIVGDFIPSPNYYTMKLRLNEVLDNVEKLSMNAIIFHLRTNNNAFYRTKLAPISSYYGTYDSLLSNRYLEEFIDECHKRGIEFHAWLNPYRISSSKYSPTTTPEDVAKEYSGYPENPASKPENILMTYHSTNKRGAILNPASKEVQDYIVKVVAELQINYDIDGIHFDDYFYAKLSNGGILSEADQDDYEAYIDSHPGYSKTSSADKASWRRDNVTNMIRKVSARMKSINDHSPKYTSFGISPTGVYKNGNGIVKYDSSGKVITNGSNTAGYDHYGHPLYADTIKWAEEGYIDYLLPQVYLGFTHPQSAYADKVDWWSAALKNTKVKLYIGLGVYMPYYKDARNIYSWETNPYEASDQVLYNVKFDNIQGVCLFRYKFMLDYYNDTSAFAHPGVKRIVDVYWKSKVQTPVYKK